MGAEAREKEIKTWSDFIEELLKDGGFIYKNQGNEKREIVYG